MPLYQYKCPMGHKFEAFRKIDADSSTAECPCGREGTKQLAAPRVLGDIPGYSCPITGAWVEGRKAHRENLAKHGCRVLETGEREQAIKAAAAREAEFDARLDESLDMALAGMGSDKLATLANEAADGITVEIARK